MRVIRVSARKSDLARLQAYRVGNALIDADAGVRPEYLFRESLGDKNLQDALWKMPEKGVFTEDFYADLVKGDTDCVVHSWKDLPIEEKPETEIIATLSRADSRDLLLLKKDRIEGERDLRILSSSPRRAYNLTACLPELLPFPTKSLEFLPVRGNIATRLKKCAETADADGIIIAKAALDRLLAAPEEEFQPGARQMREHLKLFRFVVLPLSLNPTAAAQGALAIEIRRDRQDLRELFARVHDAEVFANVQYERQVLKKHGGGCHQKIGASAQAYSFGRVFSLRGKTDAGLVLETFELQKTRTGEKFARSEVFPPEGELPVFFDREARDPAEILGELKHSGANSYLVSRISAWPKGFRPPEEIVVYAAGLSTWRALAQAGVFVSGSLEGLGEERLPELDALTGESRQWVKLAHEDSSVGMRNIPSYRLISKDLRAWNLGRYRAFYWMSASSFARAVETAPEILGRRHFCGPGNTYTAIREKFGAKVDLEVELGLEGFLKGWVKA